MWLKTNNVLFIGMWRDLVARDLARSDVSREIRLVSQERDDILAKYFYNVHIRAAPLIITNCACDLDSNTHAILFLNDNDSAMSI